MTAAPEEATTLLLIKSEHEATHPPDLHDILLTPLDAEHEHDLIHEEPPTPSARRVKGHLQCVTTAPGHGHPLSHDVPSPALVFRLRQAFNHGFLPILGAMRSHLKRHRPPAFKSAADAPRTFDNSTKVYGVFVIAIFTMLDMKSVSPSLLLYMNDSGFTSAECIAPYFVASALTTATPILSNLALGAIAKRYGSGFALIAGAIVYAIGLLVWSHFTFSKSVL